MPVRLYGGLRTKMKSYIMCTDISRVSHQDSSVSNSHLGGSCSRSIVEANGGRAPKPPFDYGFWNKTKILNSRLFNN